VSRWYGSILSRSLLVSDSDVDSRKLLGSSEVGRSIVKAVEMEEGSKVISVVRRSRW
jgi:hypothetical protein